MQPITDDSRISNTAEDVNDSEDIGSPTPMNPQRFPTAFPAEMVLRLQKQSRAELDAVDKNIVEKGMNLFFNNKFRQAEDLFEASYREDCLIASAYATLGTIRAVLSMEQSDVDEACQRLQFASALSSAIAPEAHVVTKTIAAVTTTVTSIMTKATDLFSGWGRSKENPVASPTSGSGSPNSPPAETFTAAQFRAKVVHAESEALRATLLLIQDSLAAYVKAGFALRRAYNTYAKLEVYISETGSEVDVDSREGVHFGLGCIHVLTSILPPKVLNILKALGYMHDRTKGFEHLDHCLRSKTLRSPLASLFLLAFHGVLPSFAVLMAPTSLVSCAATMEEVRKTYHSSVIHLWFAGRVERLSRNVALSTATLQRCLDHGSELKDDLPQLQHFALYDQGWNYAASMEWAKACEVFEVLEKESNWSKKAFSYAAACCYEMLGTAYWAKSVGEDVQGFAAGIVDCSMEDCCQLQRSMLLKSSEAYKRCAAYPPTRLGGRVISIDQFVGRRVTEILTRTQASINISSTSEEVVVVNTVPMCGLELLLLFQILPQMPHETLCMLAGVTRRVAASMVHWEERPTGVWKEALADVGTITDFTNGPFCKKFRGETCVLLLLLANATRDGSEETSADSFRLSEVYYRVLCDQSKDGCDGGDEGKWVIPYALYERGVGAFRYEVNTKHSTAAAAAEVLQRHIGEQKSRFGGTDYNFEMQMQLRIHLTQDFIRHL